MIGSFRSFQTEPSIVAFCFIVVSHDAVAKGGDPIRVACVGASITFGYGLNSDRQTYCYPAQLQKRLGDQFEVRNFGRSGHTLSRNSGNSYWNTPEFTNAKDFEPHIVIIQLGSNDANPENWNKCQNGFSQTLAEMVKTFSDLKSKPEVFVCLPPPMFKKKNTLWNDNLNKYIRPIIKDTCVENRFRVIDLFAPLVGRSDVYQKDGIHPTRQGAAIIAKTVDDALSDLKSVKKAKREKVHKKQTSPNKNDPASQLIVGSTWTGKRWQDGRGPQGSTAHIIQKTNQKIELWTPPWGTDGKMYWILSISGRDLELTDMRYQGQENPRTFTNVSGKGTIDENSLKFDYTADVHCPTCPRRNVRVNGSFILTRD